MNESVIIRIARPLYERVLADLERPHSFAAERVGFLFTRRGTGPAGMTLLFPVEYLPVADDHYLDEGRWDVGAAITGDAIRTAMQHVMVTGMGALHVHLHDHRGRPHFSPIDWTDLPGFAHSFQNADARLFHGAVVLSRDAAAGAVWRPGQAAQKPVQPRISLIGYPLISFEGEHDD